MLKESILYESVGELAKRIETKQLSPVELTEAYLERSQQLGPQLNAYARLMPVEALDQARAAEKDIHGTLPRAAAWNPYAAKDLLAVKGVQTTWGAKPFAEQVSITTRR